MTTKQGTISVTEHVNTDLRDYSLYTIYSRAIPSVVDGFKPVQRKAFFAALKTCRTSKMKTVAFGGNAIAISEYHHGDGSMVGSIINLTQPFNNNVPMFEGEGSFGSRLVQTSASPRYTFVKMNQEILEYFKDSNLAPENPDHENPEPLFYLPIIPWVLVNGVKGIAVGFATNILPRSPKDVAMACRDYLNGKKIKPIPPTFPMFRGPIVADGDGWNVYGIIKRKSATKIEIEEIPYGYDREKYVVELEKLEDRGKIIRFDDRCSKKGFSFEVTLPNSAKNLTDDQVIEMLKLRKRYSENLTVIDEEGNLKIFDGAAQLIEHFCDFRLKYFPIRYKKLIDDATSKIAMIKNKIKFIVLVLEGKIVFKNKTKQEILDQVIGHGFTKEVAASLIGIPIYSLSRTTLEELAADIKALEAEIADWKSVDFKKQFIEELTTSAKKSK